MLDGPYGQFEERTFHCTNPRGDAWGQEQTTREWPVGDVVVMGPHNQYYDAPPPHGRQIRRETLDINIDRHVIVESRFVPEFRHSRWVAVRFEFEGQTVWTNVVRDPIVQRNHRSSNHYVNWHTQWGVGVMQ